MLRMILPLLGLLLALVPASAQVSEVGLTGGASYYIGDINPLRHYPAYMHPAGGLFYRYNIDPHYAVRAQGLYTRLEAYDSNSSDPVQQARNLGFRTNIFELAITLEVNFLKYRSIDRKNNHLWTPYLFVGFGYFHMNPQNRLDDTWYDLQPLGTEGQGTSAGGPPYKLDVFNIPHGFGFKFALTDRVDLGLEWGLRRTWTDHLDDVSGVYADRGTLIEEAGPLTAALADPSDTRGTGLNNGRSRGDSNTKDWYQYTGLSLSLLLTRFTECDAMWDKMKRR